MQSLHGQSLTVTTIDETRLQVLRTITLHYRKCSPYIVLLVLRYIWNNQICLSRPCMIVGGHIYVYTLHKQTKYTYLWPFAWQILMWTHNIITTTFKKFFSGFCFCTLWVIFSDPTIHFLSSTNYIPFLGTESTTSSAWLPTCYKPSKERININLGKQVISFSLPVSVFFFQDNFKYLNALPSYIVI